jgi:hypothetical protein
MREKESVKNETEMENLLENSKQKRVKKRKEIRLRERFFKD